MLVGKEEFLAPIAAQALCERTVLPIKRHRSHIIAEGLRDKGNKGPRGQGNEWLARFKVFPERL
jgi:hypothetical protein